ncbi:MAG: precorrin-6y C5,15-methyltransferase (decarboxylating) subunit CbiE [Acidimicrobiia bacterium]
MGEGPVSVVGMVGGHTFGPDARAALSQAEVLVGSPRHLLLAGPATAGAGAEAEQVEQVESAGPLPAILARIASEAHAGRRVCVLASGDPGFFGIVRALAARFGPERLVVHPAPSSVALAFARVGVSWDDALVVSAHGRPLDEAVAAACDAAKVAVFTSPDNPPQALGAALVKAGCGPRLVTVASRMGEAGETVTATDLSGLATGTYDPLSVVILRVPEPASAAGPTLAWGRSEDVFAHRAGMITKAEVRAVTLGKLALPATGVLWDVGAGSGSVAVEAACVAPGLRVFAVEREPADAARVADNAVAHGAAVETVVGAAPAALAGLPDPHRVFVGGGGLGVLDACLSRLRPGGTVVANYALVDRAVAAWERLGNMVEVTISRGTPLAGGVRLAAENPVFVCWGPDDGSSG